LTTTLSQRGSEIQEPANGRKSEYREIRTHIVLEIVLESVGY